MPDLPETVEMPTQLMNDVLNYLQTKPFGEVQPLIAAIVQAAQPQNGEGQLAPPKRKRVAAKK